jgi:hypothetical protein
MAKLLISQIIDKVIGNSKFHYLSEDSSYHHNVFTFTLFRSEGRAGVAWEPSNKMILILPRWKIKCLSLLPLISSLHPLFIYPSYLSPFRFKGLRNLGTCYSLDKKSLRNMVEKLIGEITK